MLSHASLKNNKHLNILSSQFNQRKEERVRITRPNSFIPGLCLEMRKGGWGRASILSVMPNAAPDTAPFTVQLSHPYMTTGQTKALTRWMFVSKEMSLLFNMLSRLVIAFLPRSKHLLISWLQSPSAVILEPPKIKNLSLFPHLFAMK